MAQPLQLLTHTRTQTLTHTHTQSWRLPHRCLLTSHLCSLHFLLQQWASLEFLRKSVEEEKRESSLWPPWERSCSVIKKQSAGRQGGSGRWKGREREEQGPVRWNALHCWVYPKTVCAHNTQDTFSLVCNPFFFLTLSWKHYERFVCGEQTLTSNELLAPKRRKSSWSSSFSSSFKQSWTSLCHSFCFRSRQLQPEVLSDHFIPTNGGRETVVLSLLTLQVFEEFVASCHRPHPHH